MPFQEVEAFQKELEGIGATISVISRYKGGNMKRTIPVATLCLLWAFMLVKTLLAMHYHDLGPTMHYYTIMLKNTWQAHFNVDLLIHSVLFACWMVYRVRGKLVGVLCGLGAIYMGAIFTLLYLLVVFVQSKGDLDLFLRGKTMNFDHQTQQLDQ